MEQVKKETLKLQAVQIEMLVSPTPLGIAFNEILENAKEWTNKQPIVYYWLRRFAERMSSIIKTYLKMKAEYVDQYGKKDEGGRLLAAGKNIPLNDPNFFDRPEEFAEKMGKLQMVKEDIGFYPISIDWSNIPELKNKFQMEVLMMLCEPDRSLEVENSEKSAADGKDLKNLLNLAS